MCELMIYYWRMSDNKCDYCGKEVYLPFRCPYCGGKFCEEHRLPENHNCPSLKEKRIVPYSSVVHSDDQVIRTRISRNVNVEKMLLIVLAVLSIIALIISFL